MQRQSIITIIHQETKKTFLFLKRIRHDQSHHHHTPRNQTPLSFLRRIRSKSSRNMPDCYASRSVNMWWRVAYHRYNLPVQLGRLRRCRERISTEINGVIRKRERGSISTDVQPTQPHWKQAHRFTDPLHELSIQRCLRAHKTWERRAHRCTVCPPAEWPVIVICFNDG